MEAPLIWEVFSELLVMLLDFSEHWLGELEEGSCRQLSDDSSCLLQGGNKIVEFISLLLIFSPAGISFDGQLVDAVVVALLLASLIIDLSLLILLLLPEQRKLLIVISPLVGGPRDNLLDLDVPFVALPSQSSLPGCFNLLFLLEVVPHLSQHVKYSFNSICCFLGSGG